ncbi:MAG: hypothetical protein ACRDLM_11360 [Gaiellaceae bacterium]
MSAVPEPVVNPVRLLTGRAVGGPVSRSLLAAYFGVASAAWLGATVAGIVAAGDLAANQPLSAAPVLAVHLVTLGALPFAVSGASFHLLPVMLRNDLPSQRALWLALPLLGGGFVVAAGMASATHPAVWVGAGLVTCGLAIVLWEIAMLVARAPQGRMLIASRLGVALSAGHVVVALCLGAVIFSQDAPFAGVAYGRWLLVHLQIGLLGWIAVLVVTIGRSLVPMLAQAPTAPSRSRPLQEVSLVAGLWVLLAGIAVGNRAVTLAGGVAVVLSLGSFARLLLRIALQRRGAFEAPLAHLLVGGLFLAQAAGVGLTAAAGAGGRRLVIGYVVLLLVGWAAGVVLGHAAKLLSLSLWVWWPPGPRPKQVDLYPRRLGLVETLAFAAGVEVLAAGIVAGSQNAARVGATVLCASAVLTAATVLVTWSRRSRA